MPEKNPDVYTQIWAWISTRFANDYSLVCAVILAFFVSLFRSFLYGGKDTPKRVLAEACLCSLIVYSVDPILFYFQFDKAFLIPVGTTIGLFGTSVIRQMIFKFLKNKGIVNGKL